MGYLKPKKRKKRLDSRIGFWQNNSLIQTANQRSPGTYMKPGSLNK